MELAERIEEHEQAAAAADNETTETPADEGAPADLHEVIDAVTSGSEEQGPASAGKGGT